MGSHADFGVTGRDSEDVATLLSSSWRKMRSLVLQKRNVQEFQFRQYLFAAQASASTSQPVPGWTWPFHRQRKVAEGRRHTCIHLVIREFSQQSLISLNTQHQQSTSTAT